MPIRFRCVYCDKLLGIARRKAGAVVNCPQCGQPLIVPSPEPETQAAAAVSPTASEPVPSEFAPAPLPSPIPSAPTHNPGRLFEHDDFDVLLEGDRTLPAPNQEPPPQRKKSGRSAANPLPPRPFPVEQSLPSPSDRYPAPLPLRAPAGLLLSPGKMVIAIAAVLVLIILAFGGGIVVGRMLH